MNRHTMSLSCFTTLLVSLGLAMVSLNVAQAKNIKKQNLLELMNDAESIVVGTKDYQNKEVKCVSRSEIIF